MQAIAMLARSIQPTHALYTPSNIQGAIVLLRSQQMLIKSYSLNTPGNLGLTVGRSVSRRWNDSED
jgi:hypothetical protein